MSIILNALKKSEQERLVSQEEALANHASEQLKLTHKKTPTWLFVLVIINLFFLSYFIWVFTNDATENLKNIALENPHKLETEKIDISQNPVINLTKVSPQQTITKQIKKPPKKNKSVQTNQRVIKQNVVKTGQSNTQGIQSKNKVLSKKNPESIASLKNKPIVYRIEKIQSEVIQNKQINSTKVIKPKDLHVTQSEIKFNQPINKTQPKINPKVILSLNETNVDTETGEKKPAVLEKPTLNPSNIIKPKVLQPRQSDLQISQIIKDTKSKTTPEAIIPFFEADDINNQNKPTITKNIQIKPSEAPNKQTTNKQIDNPQTKAKTFDDRPNQQNSISFQNSSSDTNKKSLKDSVRSSKNKKTNSASEIDNNTIIKQPPFLSELDYEFRRTVPNIKINVFVYSENKKNRFIMVNMTKLVPGNEIIEGMILNEIRMNSIVVDYRNKIFRINR